MGMQPPGDDVLHAQVLGEQELAKLLGVKLTTVHAWSSRRNRALLEGEDDYADWHLAPPDFANVNGTKAWRRLTIIKWAARTGRLEKAPWLAEEGAKWAPPGGPRRWRRNRKELAGV